jgi:hypothetical protein
MPFEAELTLLIKSRYPLIAVDTVDEDYVLAQLHRISEGLGLQACVWSLTRGLRVGRNENSFYKSGDPAAMLRVAGELAAENKPQLFLFCDFDRHLSDAGVARLFKDLLGRLKGTPSTVVLLGSAGKLPPDLAPLSARIQGGYPGEREILAEVNKAVAEFRNSGMQLHIDMPSDTLRRLIKTLKGLSVQQVRSALNRCLLKDSRFDAADLAEIEKFKKEAFDQEGILEYFGAEQPGAIAGFDNLKKWIRSRRGAFFSEGPLPPPKGLLLLGVQGCGKSLAAKVTAGELGIPLYRLDLTRLYSKYIGETEENLRKALATVERLAPVCLWIDEIEKIFAASGGDIDGGVSKRVLGTMLTWMQERKDRSFIAATSNDIDNLPPELLRKGRFDEIFFADLPDSAARREVLRIHLRARGLNPETFDTEALAAASGGFSGAEIEQAVISALYGVTGTAETLSTAHVEEQLKLTRPLSLIKAEEVEGLRTWARERRILPV